jgi:glycosyltransferase involved in cell wall biosynthesis
LNMTFRLKDETSLPGVAVEDTMPSAAGRSSVRILGFATQGAGGDDEDRMRALAAEFRLQVVAFDSSKKFQSFLRVLDAARSTRPDLILMEGTGFGGGAAALVAKGMFGVKYVVSSGDAVSPFLTAKWPLGKPLFSLYERLLYKHCAGFIGWTPYLVGRALTFGARRAVTIAGWAPHKYSRAELSKYRSQMRAQLDISPGTIVFGLAGSLAWARRRNYCYGHELVAAVRQSKSRKVKVLIVGDGDGAKYLRDLAGEELGSSVILTGRVPRADVPKYLAAMDVGSLPQSTDGVGSFRFTTKISEYLAARLPFVTNAIPASYDLDTGAIQRLPGSAPWDEQFIRSLADFMDGVTREWVETARASIPECISEFDEQRQLRRFHSFIAELAESSRA